MAATRAPAPPLEKPVHVGPNAAKPVIKKKKGVATEETERLKRPNETQEEEEKKEKWKQSLNPEQNKRAAQHAENMHGIGDLSCCWWDAVAVPSGSLALFSQFSRNYHVAVQRSDLSSWPG